MFEVYTSDPMLTTIAAVVAATIVLPIILDLLRLTTTFDLIINASAPILTPILVKVSPFFKPIYRLTDICLGKNHRKSGRPSNAYKPVVVFASRTLKNAAKYKELWTKYAQKAQEGSGVRCVVSFMDTEKRWASALQLWWYDSADDFTAQPPELIEQYAESAMAMKEDYTQVWGGWDDALKAKLSAGKGKCSFVRDVRGFLREASPEQAKGFTTGEPPMIWISKRNVLPDRMGICGRNFQLGTDMMYRNAPAALGICEYTADDNPDATWSLRVFNSYESGFKRHFPVPSWILFRMVFNVIPEWAPGMFPVGYSFSSKEHIDAAVASNAGNKAYKQYYWEKDLLGPLPDFGKGLHSAA